MYFIALFRETSLRDIKGSENSRVHCIEKMDNKTIQKLRDLYLKVSVHVQQMLLNYNRCHKSLEHPPPFPCPMFFDKKTGFERTFLVNGDWLIHIVVFYSLLGVRTRNTVKPREERTCVITGTSPRRRTKISDGRAAN